MTKKSATQKLTPALGEWAGVRTGYPRDKTVASLFEEISSLYPDRVALSFRSANLSYSELNRRANQLAHHLLRMGVSKESLVGLCVERSPEMIVGMLAILKAGAAYVPFDATYPAERIAFMIADTKVSVMLTQKAYASSIPGNSDLATILLDKWPVESLPGDDQNPQSAATASTLAYVMYTSGSTGRPKGVMVENRSIVRLVCNTSYCQFGRDEVFLQLAPISFDASTFEIWGALLHGAQLVIMPPQPPSLEEIGDHIRQHQVSILWLTAGLFHLFVDQQVEDLRPLRQLLAGGDSLSSTHVRRVLEHLPHLTLINGYGPTENTTFTSCHAMRNGDAITNSVSIGRPIANTFVYLLNDELQPVPAGEIGELCAGGDGVARGYLNSLELTAEKFVANPFSGNPGSPRLYRTGDLARWRPDGTLEFLGRNDMQVKILGHRIELGEIEAVLSQHPKVRQACVKVQSDTAGNKRLAAYYVCNAGQSMSADELKAFLTVKLPTYMLPATFLRMDVFPLTSNGKVDRGALPASNEAKGLAPPAKGTDLEEQLADLWKEILGTQRIGLDENFFDLGGDSLLIVAVHSRLQKILQREIQVTDLFEYATVRSLARYLGESARTVQTFAAAQEQAKKQREALIRKRLVKEMTP